MNGYDNSSADGGADLMYQQALAKQLEGQAEEAESLYFSALEAEPGHVMARHNLAMLLFAGGNADDALGMMLDAVEAAPREVQLWLGLVEILKALGQFGYLSAAVEQARAAGLSDEDVARVAEQATSGLTPDEASPAESSATPESSEPAADAAVGGSPLPQYVVEVIERDRTLPPYKIPATRRAGPTAAQAKKGLDLFKRRKYKAVQEHAREMIRRHGQHPLGWHLLGVAQLQEGESFFGVEALLKAVYRKPGDAEYIEHLAQALDKLQKRDLAAFCFERAREIAPDRPSLLLNYSVCELNRGNFDGADELTRQLCEKFPHLAQGFYVRGLYHMRRQQTEEAREAYRKAIELNPTLSAAYQDLGLSYFNSGLLDEALQLSREAIEHMPNNAACFSNLLFFASHDERITPERLFEMHKEYAERYEKPLMKFWRPHDNDPSADRKLRIGFVSADFRRHAVSNFFLPVLKHLDKQQFDLFGFCNNEATDEVTEEIRREFKYWLPVAHVSDEGLAEIIRACKIDILVDLSGHTAGNRLLTFARKPSPIQVGWIGYLDTTGLSAMDYILVDSHQAPDSSYQKYYTEKLWCVDDLGLFDDINCAFLPNESVSKEEKEVTFGSFNRLGKVNDKTLKLWRDVLCEIPGSRIIIGAVGSEVDGQRLMERLKIIGFPVERLEIKRRCSFDDYLALHQCVDVVLDSFPYNGGTTSHVAVSQGVPILTMRGDRIVANNGSAIMSRLGMSHYVADTEGKYVDMAKKMVRDVRDRSNFRSDLREAVKRRCRVDARDIASNVSAAFLKMWGESVRYRS